MILFRNRGLIDLFAITTMGVNVKEGDHPIGQFGTGLKYAIAIILRSGGRIMIDRGGEFLRFGVMETAIRGKTFQIVTMNDKPLGFTTQLGLHWKTWMAFREIYCNCKDEGGQITATIDDTEVIAAGHDETLVIVEGAEFDKHYRNRDEFMLETEPLYRLAEVHVHAGESRFCYYRGIRVGELRHPSKFTYNLTGYVELTEDRTLAHPTLIPWYIVRSLVQASDELYINDVLRADEKSLESKLDWDDVRDKTPGPAFMRVAGMLYGQKRLTGGALKLFKTADEQRLMIAGERSAVTVTPSAVQASIINSACQLVRERGLPIGNYTVTLKSSLPNNIDSVCKHRGLEIEISEALVARGDRSVARALTLGIARSHGGAVDDRLLDLIFEGRMLDVDETRSVQEDEAA
jgi:hypothetical protein